MDKKIADFIDWFNTDLVTFDNNLIIINHYITPWPGIEISRKNDSGFCNVVMQCLFIKVRDLGLFITLTSKNNKPVIVIEN